MKVTVSTQNQTVEVSVPRYSTLTPKSAIAAAHVAFGAGANCKVSDGQKTYRVGGAGSKRQVRKA